MKIIDNNLDGAYETWEDPGDYPSGAGGGPLPSHKSLNEINGFLELELTIEDLLETISDNFAFQDNLVAEVKNTFPDETFEMLSFGIQTDSLKLNKEGKETTLRFNVVVDQFD